MPLKRVKILHPHPCLKHINLRLNDAERETEYGGWVMFLREAGGFVHKKSDPYPIYTQKRTGGI